jgi:hypothetical protein
VLEGTLRRRCAVALIVVAVAFLEGCGSSNTPEKAATAAPVLARFHGRKSFTSFLFQTATGGVVEIELGNGVGLAQELKEQRKK